MSVTDTRPPLRGLDLDGLVAELHEHARDRGWSTDALDRALTLAQVAHLFQRRAFPDEPYVLHPLRVAARAARWGARFDVVVAALLHDTVEDQATRIVREMSKRPGAPDWAHRRLALRHIAYEFGGRVAAIVEKVTNPEYADRPPVEVRNARYAEHVLDAIEDVDALIVKAADLYDNAFTLVEYADHRRESALRLTVKYLPVLIVVIRRLIAADTANAVPGAVLIAYDFTIQTERLMPLYFAGSPR